MSIEWSSTKGMHTSIPMVYIYKTGSIQVNRSALKIIMEKSGDMLNVLLGYDSEKKCCALQPVKEKNLNSFSASSGTISCPGFLRKHNLIPGETVRCKLIPENDYYIFYPEPKKEIDK